MFFDGFDKMGWDGINVREVSKGALDMLCLRLYRSVVVGYYLLDCMVDEKYHEEMVAVKVAGIRGKILTEFFSESLCQSTTNWVGSSLDQTLLKRTLSESIRTRYVDV